MVAPNGARLTPEDHPAIPVTVTDLVDTVVACATSGAVAVHLHARDEKFKHVLDAEQYRQSIELIQSRLGNDFPVQITTEAVGVFTQQEQIDVVKAVRPEFASAALVEIAGPDCDLEAARDFYRWTVEHDVAIQHILYSPEEFVRFFELQDQGIVPAEHRAVLFVLGRYTAGQQSDPESLAGFLDVLDAHERGQSLHWMICAFGSRETECLLKAAGAGGHARVGFENNRHNPDGSIADNNETRVAMVCQGLEAQGNMVCSRESMRTILGSL